MQVSTVTNANRKEWLAERRKSIGASEAPAVLGFSPWETPLSLYLRKVGEAPEPEETEAMRLGSKLEPLLAELWEELTGRRVERTQVFLRSETVPFLSATLDGITAEGNPVEFKTISAYKSRSLGDEDTDEIPDHWIIQAHQQMLLHPSHPDAVDFGVLVGGQRFRTFKVWRDQSIIDEMVPKLVEFWDRVKARKPPAPSFPADSGLLLKLYPGCSGAIDLGDAELDLVEDWLATKESAKLADQAAKDLRSRLLNAMGNAAAGHLPDGRILSRKLIEIGASIVNRNAYTRVDLRLKGATSHE